MISRYNITSSGVYLGAGMNCLLTNQSAITLLQTWLKVAVNSTSAGTATSGILRCSCSVVVFDIVDTLALINPFAIYVDWFSQCIDSGAEVFLTDPTRSLADQVLHINPAFNTTAMIAEWAGKYSIKLVHPLLRWWLSR